MRHEAAAMGTGQLSPGENYAARRHDDDGDRVFCFMFVWQYNDSYYTNMLVGNFKTMTSELSRAANDFRLGIFSEQHYPPPIAG